MLILVLKTRENFVPSSLRKKNDSISSFNHNHNHNKVSNYPPRPAYSTSLILCLGSPLTSLPLTLLAEVALPFGNYHDMIKTEDENPHDNGDTFHRLARSKCVWCERVKPRDRLVSKKYSITTTWHCKQCEQPLHPECFAIYHNSQLNT